MKQAALLLVCLILFTACSSPSQTNTSALQFTATGASELPTHTPFPTKTDAPTSTPTSTQKPPATEAPASPVAPSSTVQVCTNQAEFVRHLSVSDNTQLLPGVYFAKVWRIKNIGTCTWTTDYAFVFENGDNFSSVSDTLLSREVKPGETVDIQVAMVTPMEPKTYSGYWMFRDPSGNLFGAGAAADQPFSAIVVVEPLTVNERLETLSCG